MLQKWHLRIQGNTVSVVHIYCSLVSINAWHLQEGQLISFEEKPDVKPFVEVTRNFPATEPTVDALREVDDLLKTMLLPEQVPTYLQVCHARTASFPSAPLRARADPYGMLTRPLTALSSPCI